ncbi:E3 ubiquitin-protein ligase TRIM45-like [Lytechinus pictus]|uniref:E3 ubiquitin-protein ligase TRIM45-like n=1 Tax=Lytechinus pictus TaxID=7653 RepID=UPI0030BA2471
MMCVTFKQIILSSPLSKITKGDQMLKAERIKGSGGTTIQTCTVCDGDDEDIATYYCQNCSEYLCEDCLQHHNRYKRNAYHETVKVIDLEMGIVKKKFKCPKHHEELQQYVCTTCLVRICGRCQEVKHKEDGHEVILMTKYEERQQNTIECLLMKTDQTSADIENRLSSVNEKLGTVENIVAQLRQEIGNAYDIADKNLQRKRNVLLEECDRHYDTFRLQFEDISKCYRNFLQTLPALKATLENDMKDGVRNIHNPDYLLKEHTARVNELERSLKAEAISPLLAQTSNVVLRAESIVFRPADRTIDLGTVLSVQAMDHQLNTELEDSISGATCMASAIEDDPEKKDVEDLHSTRSGRSVRSFFTNLRRQARIRISTRDRPRLPNSQFYL